MVHVAHAVRRQLDADRRRDSGAGTSRVRRDHGVRRGNGGRRRAPVRVADQPRARSCSSRSRSGSLRSVIVSRVQVPTGRRTSLAADGRTDSSTCQPSPCSDRDRSSRTPTLPTPHARRSMIRRAVPALVVVAAGFAALIAIGRDESSHPVPFFATPAGAWMPAVNDEVALTGSWFCPGVPATGEDGVGGEVVVANRDDEQLVGLHVLTPDGPAAEAVARRRAVVAGRRSTSTAFVDGPVRRAWSSRSRAGRDSSSSVRSTRPATRCAPCANNTSDEWYFADGFTVDGSIETLVLTNPYDDAASRRPEASRRPRANRRRPRSRASRSRRNRSRRSRSRNSAPGTNPSSPSRSPPNAAGSSWGGRSTTSAAAVSATT